MVPKLLPGGTLHPREMGKRFEERKKERVEGKAKKLLSTLLVYLFCAFGSPSEFV